MPAMTASPSKSNGRQWCDVDSEVTSYPANAQKTLVSTVDGEVGVYASMSKARVMTPASPSPPPNAQEVAPEELSPGKKWCDVDGEIGVYPITSKKSPTPDVDGELSVYAAMAKAQTLTPASPPVLPSAPVAAPEDLSPGKRWSDVDGEVGVYAAMAKQARSMKARIARAASPQPSSVRKFEIHVKDCQLQSFSFDYYMHGLVEETGEVFEAVRAARSTAAPSQADTDNVLNEIGDVLWYATSLSLEVGGELRMPDSWPTAEAGACEPEVLMLAAAARLSGRVKKSMRGDKSLAQFTSAMAQHRDELLKRCAEVAANHNANLQQCATMNVRKLSGRFERNTVRGDGDHR